MSVLQITVRFYDGRYYGAGDWPPSPMRLFQALVAGAGLRGPLTSGAREALTWLEQQAAPLIAAPLGRRTSRPVKQYLPNNSSDLIGGDPARIGEIRAADKVDHPVIFDATLPVVYAWPLPDTEPLLASTLSVLADGLYQLGRGVDGAWAWSDLVSDADWAAWVATYPGAIWYPVSRGAGPQWPVPMPGSLASLDERWTATATRRSTRSVAMLPPPIARWTSYVGPPTSVADLPAALAGPPGSGRLFELRDPSTVETLVAWPLAQPVSLVQAVRDAVIARLQAAWPAEAGRITRVLRGRQPDGTPAVPLAERVRFIPVASIGHPHADAQIRRLWITVPSACPFAPDDVFWAVGGASVADPATGAVRAVLIPATTDRFAAHYGMSAPTAVWESVTPVALPVVVSRKSASDGPQRVQRQARLAQAVAHAIRHAGVPVRLLTVHVQREPWQAQGLPSTAFADTGRWPASRLWHVRIELQRPVTGPLVLGDGRFLGLGVMAPSPHRRDAS